MFPLFFTLDQECPHCNKNHSLKVSDILPIQKFDLKCCSRQTLTLRILKTNQKITIREALWELDNV